MSNREYAHTLLDRIPESRLAYIVYYLEGTAVVMPTTDRSKI